MSVNKIVYSRRARTFIHKGAHLSVLALGLLLLDVGCGGSSSSDSSSPGSAAPGSSSGGNSSSTAERVSLCKTMESKCKDSAGDKCESELAGTSSAYVQAVEACLNEWTGCDDDIDSCRDRAKSEVAEGFPNTPIITECKDKLVVCQPSSKDYYVKVCESLVRLDDVGQTRASECAGKECNVFTSCLEDFDHDY